MAGKGLVFDKDFLKRGKGGYVFLSHSHKDIEDVRIIRNIFEEKGFEPLCFFLKCLSDDDEVEDLIKREIDARDFFVYVESKNAENSRWVRTEREYVSKSGKSQNSIFRINLDEFRKNQQCDVKFEAEIERIVRTRRIFLSYSSKDRDIAYKIASALQERDFNVWTDQEISLGSDWYDEIAGALKEAAEYGCVIPIITKNSINSKWIETELCFSYQKNAPILPVMIGDNIKLNTILEFFLLDKQFSYIKDIASEEEIHAFADRIEMFMTQKYNSQKNSESVD